MSDSIIYHIDVNSAFLSWEACYRIHSLGETLDLRLVPSVVGGNEELRHGIVLAKSTPAKKYEIQTGEALALARKKCPNLLISPPNYPMYVESSKAFIALLRRYCPKVEQYSIDEAFCDMSGTQQLYGSPVLFARVLKDKIHSELGFTVNIGVSTNKLLAKMASDFKKPNQIHTLFPREISSKLWPLPVSELFYVGRSSTKKLHTLGITTIGELAHTDLSLLHLHFGKFANVIWKYANGLDGADLTPSHPANKGYGNSLTVRFDVVDAATAKMVLLSLTETVGERIRADKAYVSVVAISIVDYEFHHLSHQMTLLSSTDVTLNIYETACLLFDQAWNKVPIRQLGIHTSKATTTKCMQYNLFDLDKFDKHSKLDVAIDSIRNRYGEDSIMRACFVNSKQPHMAGGIDKAKRTGITRGVSD